jgi:hypothetical protein
MAVLLLCLSFDAPRVVRNSSFDRWFQYGTTCSAFLMTWKRVSLRAKARGGSTASEESVNACCFGYILRPIKYKGGSTGSYFG